MNPKWYLILEVIRELNNRTYSLSVGRTIYQKVCYVLTRNGVDTGFAFVKSAYGPFSAGAKNAISALANANLITEKQLGRMISLSVADDVVIHKKKFTKEEWEATEKTVDLFGRVKRTEQAEMVATVLFAYDELSKNDGTVTDKSVYDYVIDWKSHWGQDKNKEFEVCDTINNLAMLSLMNVVHTGEVMDTMLV